jgi:ABC-type glutathione transport system ATPase component
MQIQPDSQADAVGLADLAPAIRVERLSKVFGERVAVNELSFEVPQGVVCGFVGPNGAGKTTTIRMLLAMARPTSGHGFVLGQPIEKPTRSPRFEPGDARHESQRSWQYSTSARTPRALIDDCEALSRLLGAASPGVLATLNLAAGLSSADFG